MRIELGKVQEGFIRAPEEKPLEGDKGRQLEFPHEIIQPQPSLIEELRANYKEVGRQIVVVCILSGVIYGPIIVAAFLLEKPVR